MGVAVLVGGLLVSGAHAQTPADGDLRLTAGSAYKGVLEVYHDNEWGLVCNNHPESPYDFDDVNATVACTQLGYQSGRSFPDEHSSHDISGQPRWLDDVNCDGTESRLVDCAHQGLGVSSCGRFEYIVIACSDVSGPATIDYTENGTEVVGTYTTDGSPAWSLGGDDADDFAISTTGALTFNSPPDYETPTDADEDNVYEVTVQTGITDDVPLAVTITVTNVITTTGTSSIEYAENGTEAVATYFYDGTELPTWSVGGTDADDFTISTAGVLTFNSPPDYETPTDADEDNVYAVTVQNGITAGTPITVTITVTNVTAIRGSYSTRYFENRTRRVRRYTYTGDGSPTWSVGGTDADDFTISATGSTTADLTFTTPPDYENPTDADRDNVYEVTVQAGTNPDAWQAVTITIIDVGVQGHGRSGTTRTARGWRPTPWRTGHPPGAWGGPTRPTSPSAARGS